ncbi:MAG TPA: iron dependent repressor, metal binding and dimerization domain protein [Candidatus Lokiarchaeia archaeon]|nr:iron dependent repressor, metal binding and dimerization domain protein [Candidatus Lokiarchaeia archaeon]
MPEVEPNSLEYRILMHFLREHETAIMPGNLAKQFDIRHSTINSALKRMEERRLIRWNHYGSIELLEDGLNALKHEEVHHHLIEVFLVDTLALTPEEAHEESFRLAPHFSCMMIQRICNKYGNPRQCPSNHVIPEYPACHDHQIHEHS